MLFEEVLKIHEEYDAIPRFYHKSGIKGGILKLPSNIIRMLPEREVIYEVDGNEIIIYENKIKVRSIKVDIDYAIVLIMIADIQNVSETQGYCLRLCRIYNSENECINSKSVIIDLFNLLNPNPKKKDLMLAELINKFMETGSGIDKVPESINDGCELVLKYYMENREND